MLSLLTVMVAPVYVKPMERERLHVRKRSVAFPDLHLGASAGGESSRKASGSEDVTSIDTGQHALKMK